ncbi:MAG: bifunctional phosphoglucose/phosphomannose isomerase [Dehalococcoidia bacterium]
MLTLDGISRLELDREDMFGHIRSLGTELVRAWERSESLELPPGADRAKGVVIAGMGGSATAADYFAAICNVSSERPVVVSRGYTLPNWVDGDTLVVISSYSGNTEELIASYDDAWKRGAMILAVTRGGKIGARADADGVPVYPIDYVAQPRAALAHSLAPLLRLGLILGITGVADAEVRDAGASHRALVESEFEPGVPEQRNPAKQTARALLRRFPLVLGAEHLAPVASRYKNQVAENGKSLAAADILPEANHNLIVGLATAADVADTLSLVTLESALYHERTSLRFDLTTKYFAEAGIPVHRHQVGGEGLLAQLLLGTAWGDYVSAYLALLNDQDPSPVPQIDRLKAELG